MGKLMEERRSVVCEVVCALNSMSDAGLYNNRELNVQAMYQI